MARYGAKEKFLVTFNPDNQTRFCADIQRLFFGAAPTLATLAEAYGEDVAIAWLVIQYHDLSEYAGVEKKLSVKQTGELARLTYIRYHYFKVTELMYFLVLFKTGEYGRFYGTVDPQMIMEGLKRFTSMRGEVIAQHETEKAAETERGETKTYEQWLEFKKNNPEEYKRLIEESKQKKR